MSSVRLSRWHTARLYIRLRHRSRRRFRIQEMAGRKDWNLGPSVLEFLSEVLTRPLDAFPYTGQSIRWHRVRPGYGRLATRRQHAALLVALGPRVNHPN